MYDLLYLGFAWLTFGLTGLAAEARSSDGFNQLRKLIDKI